MSKLLVVSHPAVIPVNQWVYARLQELGWETTIVVPRTWRNDYGDVRPEALPQLDGRLRPLRVALAGRPQRHFHLVRAGRLIRRVRPDAIFVEAECFSIPALQWVTAAARAGVPAGVQADENLDRPLPWLAKAIRRRVLSRAAFVAARSPTAADLVRRWGYRGAVSVAPHAVPRWDAAASTNGRPFTVGYAGRLVPQKGVRDLVSAMRGLEGARLLVAGDGPLRGELETEGAEVRTDTGHGGMPAVYAEMDVLVLPSRTTPTWAEQFGRVLVEALWCGVPVVGSDSGEIPWVITETGGGLVFPEGDVGALAAALRTLRDDPDLRTSLAADGRASVERLFAVDAAAQPLDTLLREAIA
jgi:glycosyltransferase involved in cell wall biosynthesis